MTTLEHNVIVLLAGEPQGLSAPELQKRLRPSVSQPTLWRALNRLRSAGEVSVEGRARATRYHLIGPTGSAVLRSRALHRKASSMIARHPEIRERGLQRLAKLRAVNPHGKPYHDRWQTLLEGPLPALLRALNEPSEQADALRKESPLTTLVDPVERERIFNSIRAA
jgi:DNA-binding PadR family transcriptional regulator